MEHILNRRTATILTYINQGRLPAAPSPFSLPVRPAAGPVQTRFPRPARARRAVRRARPRSRWDPAPRAGARPHGVPPRFPACERTAPPIIESGSPRSGDRDAAQRIRMDMGREGRREGKERMDVRMDE